MKKLFYLVLVVLIVLVLGSFINKNVDSSPSATAEVIDVIACDCDAECVCAAQRAACDCDAEAMMTLRQRCCGEKDVSEICCREKLFRA